MKDIYKRALAGLLLLLIAGGGMYIGLRPAAINGLASPVIAAKRVNDVHKIAALFEEYKAANGRYPYQDETPAEPGKTKVPVMAVIAMPAAEELLSQMPSPFGISSGRIYARQLIEVLERDLKRDVALPVDPQKMLDEAPNAYYAFFPPEGGYVVVCFLYEPNEYTVAASPHANAYAVASESAVRFLSPALKPRRYGEISAEEREAAVKEGESADAALAKSTTVAVTRETARR
jgi:hypothetical protein